MPVFEYTAKKSPTESVQGKIEANSKSGAIEQLARQNLFPLSIVESGENFSFNKQKLKVSLTSLIYFTQETADLLDSGVELIDALNLIFSQSPDKHLKYLVQILHGQIQEGKSFSEGLKYFPSIFSSLYVNIIRSGELSGSLPAVMKRLGLYYETMQKFRSKLIEAMAYPVFLICVGMAALFVLVGFVIPKLIPIFDDMGVALPLPTRIVIFFSDCIQAWGIPGVLIISAGLFIGIKIFNIPNWRSRMQLFFLNSPVLGEFIISRHLSEIFQSLETMISNGVSPLLAIEVVSESCSYYPFKDALLKAGSEVANGVSLSKSFSLFPVFPARISAIIKVGEESGKMEQSLNKLAKSYYSSFEKSVNFITKWAGPFFIFFIALFVAFILLAMILPIVNIDLSV